MRPHARGLRVLMTADAVGGVWTFATELAAELVLMECRVDLVVLGPAPTQNQLLAIAHIPGIEVVVTDLALEWLDPAGRNFARSCQSLAALARRLRPDVVHLNSYREAVADWGAPLLMTAHSCVWSWWRACRGGDPSEPEWRTYFANVRAGLANGPWVAPTAAFAREIATLYDPPTPALMIHNGIAPLRGGRTKEPFVLTAGRLWDEAKNIASLGGAAQVIPWPIRVAGSVQASAAAGSARLGAGLELLGEMSRSDLRGQMQRAAIFVSPARYEPFGLAVLEAADAGCALVLSDIPVFRELWDGAALFVDPRDADGFGSALDRLCADEQLRSMFAREAARRARSYSIAKTARSYHRLYETLAADCSRVPRHGTEFAEMPA